MVRGAQEGPVGAVHHKSRQVRAAVCAVADAPTRSRANPPRPPPRERHSPSTTQPHTQPPPRTQHSMDLMANTLLAAGASPAMAHALDEVEDFVGIADALLVNISNLRCAQESVP